MKVRVNVDTQYEAQSYLVETDDIPTIEVRKAIEFVLENPRGSTTFTNRIQVINGKILQDGYEMMEDLERARIDENVPSVSVETTV